MFAYGSNENLGKFAHAVCCRIAAAASPPIPKGGVVGGEIQARIVPKRRPQISRTRALIPKSATGTKVFGHPLLGGVESRMTERARADSKTLKSPPSARGTKCFLPRSPSLLPSFYSRDIKWGRLMSDFGFFRRRRGKLNFRRWAGRGSSVDATHPPR